MSSAAGPSGLPAAGVAEIKREVLVRHLEAWAPAALHRARRATYVHGYADADDARAAQAAVEVFADQSDLVRGRELTMIALAEDASAVQARLADAQGAAGPSAGLVMYSVPGRTDERMAAALKAAGATRFPVFGYLDAAVAPAPPAQRTLAALATGRPADVLLVLAAGVLPGLAADDLAEPGRLAGDLMFGDGRWRAVFGRPAGERAAYLLDEYRATLHDTGFPLATAVELVTGDPADPGQVLVFATTSGRSLEGFKDALWAVDEYAGVRYRDPADPARHPMDISLHPHPGPLRREVLAYLSAHGPRSVTEIRTFAMTETVYRAADANGVLSTLLAAGAVTRDPASGRLGGDVVLTVAQPSAEDTD